MSRPLDGVRVLEVGQYISAPYCAMLLADQGADVVKIERLEGGDPRRSYDPLVERDGQSMSGGFMSYNRNKRSIAINLKHPQAREVFLRLVRSADVVVENLRPGSMERVGLDYGRLREENPRLVYCAISGYGRLERYRGPSRTRPPCRAPYRPACRAARP